MSFFHRYISYFAQVDFRNDNRVFGAYMNDRINGGFYALGQTGVGKTNLLQSIAYQDIKNNIGICILDIHGQLTKNIIANIPELRKKDLVFLDTSDKNLNLGFNPLKRVPYHYRHLVASHLVEAIEKMSSSSSWGSRIEYTLMQVLIVLLDQQSASIENIYDLLTDEHYRLKCIPTVRAKSSKDF